MPSVTGGFGTLDAALEFYRQKVNLPTRTFRDLVHGQHARAAVFAGAMKEELIADLRNAVDQGIANGWSQAQFNERFNDIVKRHGWQHTGSPGWRARVIFQTNLQTAYQAGRYKQMTEPSVLAHMPWWQYRHNTVLHPREQHKAWDGMVLRWDDPFWTTHYPPNGWGCRCDVRNLSDRQLRKLGKSGPDPSPGADAPGVPEEWRYNVGESAWGKPVARDVIENQGGDRMVDFESSRGPEYYHRPDDVPFDEVRAQPIEPVRGSAELHAAFERVIGGKAAAFTDPSGAVVSVTDALIDHWLQEPKRLEGRVQYLPLLREVIEQPFEVWVGFARNEITGRIELRRRYIKGVSVGKNRILTFIADAVRGQWVSFNAFVGREGYGSGARRGFLVWGRG